MGKHRYRIYYGVTYVYGQIGIILGFAFSLWLSSRVPEARVPILILSAVIALCGGIALIMWNSYLWFTTEGVYRIIPIPGFKRAFIPWHDVSIVGIYQENAPSPFRFLYLSRSVNEVKELLKHGNLTRILFRTDSDTVYIIPRKSILNELEQYLTPANWHRITTSLNTYSFKKSS